MQMLSRINETSDFDRLDETIKYEWKRILYWKEKWKTFWIEGI